MQIWTVCWVHVDDKESYILTQHIVRVLALNSFLGFLEFLIYIPRYLEATGTHVN